MVCDWQVDIYLSHKLHNLSTGITRKACFIRVRLVKLCHLRRHNDQPKISEK